MKSGVSGPFRQHLRAAGDFPWFPWNKDGPVVVLLTMRKTGIIVSLLALVLGGSACTDSTMANLSSYGDAAKIICYSGGLVVYEGESTGKVEATTQSDGWQFMEKKSREFVRVSGTCVVRST